LAKITDPILVQH